VLPAGAMAVEWLLVFSQRDEATKTTKLEERPTGSNTEEQRDSIFPFEVPEGTEEAYDHFASNGEDSEDEQESSQFLVLYRSSIPTASEYM